MHSNPAYDITQDLGTPGCWFHKRDQDRDVHAELRHADRWIQVTHLRNRRLTAANTAGGDTWQQTHSPNDNPQAVTWDRATPMSPRHSNNFDAMSLSSATSVVQDTCTASNSMVAIRYVHRWIKVPDVLQWRPNTGVPTQKWTLCGLLHCWTWSIWYGVAHTARVVGHVLNENDVYVLPLPANSPDLSPIEHVWDEMEHGLRRLPQQLGRDLIQVPQDFHARVIGSMRRRCTAVINAQWGHTR
jgi:hypothetical protein